MRTGIANIRVLLLLVLMSSLAFSQNSSLRSFLQKHGRGKAASILRQLPRDSLITLATTEVQGRYPDFDPSLFSDERVYTNDRGIFVSWEMSIRYCRFDRPAIYGLHVDLLRGSVGATTLGKDVSNQDVHIFRWDDESRRAVQFVLRLDEKILDSLETFRYPDGLMVTIMDQGDYFDISQEVPYGGFEGYKMDKKTRRTWDHLSGIPGPYKSNDVEIED